MTEDEWDEKYQPLTDHPVEWDEVPKEYIPDRLWTLIECDDDLVISAGNHIVNRLGNYYTKHPHTFEEEVFIEVERDE